MTRAPYKYLESYTIDDADIFFGRERETETLLSDTLATKGLKNGETQVLETAIRHRFRSPPEVIDELFSLSADASMSALADDRTALVVRG